MKASTPLLARSARFAFAFLFTVLLVVAGPLAAHAQQQQQRLQQDAPDLREHLRQRQQEQLERLREQGVAPEVIERFRQRAQRQFPSVGRQVAQAIRPRAGRSNRAASRQKLSAYETKDPVRTWALAENPEPQLNFDLAGTPRRAGDVNGDGINDYLYAGNARDERTSALEDRVNKTALFYGTEGTLPKEPDQLLYDGLSPVGDLNSDGFADALRLEDEQTVPFFTGSSSGYTDSGVSLSYARSVSSLSTQARSTDFDGDGFEDVLVLNADNETDLFLVLYGANDLRDVTSVFYEVPIGGPDPASRAEAADLDGDGQSEIVRLADSDNSSSPNPIEVEIFQIDASDRSLANQQQFTTRAIEGLGGLSLADINGSGGKEIVFDGAYSDALYAFAQETGPALSFDETAVSIGMGFGRAFPVGDLDGDGRTDFYTEEGGSSTAQVTRYISYGPSDLSDGLSFDREIPFAFNTFGSAGGFYGDLDGDGIDDAVLGYFDQSRPKEVGRRFLFGNADRSAINTDDVIYPRGRFFDAIGSTENVGDVNGDGVTDFAMLRSDLDRVEVFFGGISISQNPDRSLDLTAPFLKGVAAGDFDGDGFSDIAVSYSSDDHIDVYLGGSGFDTSPDHTFDLASQASDDLNRGLSLENVGDVNGDGTDDLLVSDLTDQFFLFYGSATLPSAPGATIEIESGNTIPYPGVEAAALDDFDGDGFDDFAVGAEKTAQVYFGGANPDFAQPDLELAPPDADGQFMPPFPYGMTGGDFNGDGFGDVAVKGYSGYPNFVDNGFDLDANVFIRVYYGGTSDGAATADRVLEIPADAFGSNADSDGDGLVDFTFGQLTAVPGPAGEADQLLLGTLNPSNALLYGDVDGSDSPTAVLRAPNSAAGLGGANNFIDVQGSNAVGDFTGDGTVDAVLPQTNDDNDAAQSSRVYRYALGIESGPAQPLSIAEARERDPGADLTTSGIVTRIGPGANISGGPAFDESVYLQDETAGIVALDFSGTLPPDVQVGDQLRATGEIGAFADVLKVLGVGIGENPEAETFVRESTGNPLPEPQLLTLEEIATEGESYEAELVRVEGLTLEDASGTFTGGTNYVVSDGSDGDVALRVPTTSFYDGAPVPEGTFAATGVVVQSNGTFDSIEPQEGYQLLVLREGDLVATGTPPEVTYDVSRDFGNAADPSDYGLVALPSSEETPLANVLEGAFETGWTAYQQGENGDGLVETPNGAFAPGNGFWIIAKDGLEASATASTVEIDEDGTYAIDLHPGWNIISNPTGRPLDWSTIQAASGGLSQPLWAFEEGSYEQVEILVPAGEAGRAFYFLNQENAGELVLPYATAASPAATSVANEAPGVASWSLALTASRVPAEENAEDAPRAFRATVRAGVAEGAKEGFDARDQFAPPGRFEALGLRLLPASGFEPGAELATAYRSRDAAEGQRFRLVLRSAPGQPVTVRADRSRLEADEAAREAVLVRPSTGERFGLTAARPTAEFTPAEVEEKLTLLVGSSAFVEEAASEAAPDESKLLGSYPNPFRDRATIAYDVAEESEVRLAVYDALGRKVRTLVSEKQTVGRKEAVFEADALASGVYLVRIRIGDRVETGRLVHVR